MSTLLDGDWLRPDRRLLTVRRWTALAWTVIPGAVLSGLAAVMVRPLLGLLGLLVTAIGAGLVLLMVARRFHAWGYAEREDDLLVRRGVLVRRTTVVPYGRMQFVDVTAGPLDRRLGIATVTLHTAAAATDAAIPGLLLPEAERLRDRLAALGEARAAGL